MSDAANFPSRPPGGLRTRRVRVASGIALVLAFSALGSFRTAMRLAGMALSVPTGQNPLLKVQARLRPILDDLPPRGIVGYGARGPLKVGKHHELEGDNHAIVRYVLARYVLAPRILALDPTRPLVVRDDLDPVRVTEPERR